MNLMSNARLFDDGQNKNDLIFLPQVKFNMMGQIQNQFQQEFKKRQSSPYSSPSPPSTSSSPSPNHEIPALLDKNPGSSPAPHPTPHFSEASTLHPVRHPNPHQDHNDHQDHLNETGPLDFSNKKLKFEQGQGSKNRKRKETRHNSSQDNSSDEPDSPCSRLRNILKMKSPPGQGEGLVKDDRGTVLDLSKDNSLDNEIWNKGQKVTRPRSSSSSPSGLDLHSYLTGGRQSGQTFSFQSLGLSPYGILNSAQHSPMTTSVPYESPNYTQGGMSTAATFGPTLAPTLGPILGGPSQTTGTFASTAGMGKSRVTRPFKAYPKDPLTFPTVGLYGLPVVGPTPAVSEALIHQQSNHAYAEFRKQMLNQSNNSRSKRVGHSSKGYHPTGQEPLSDSTTSSTNPMDFGLGGGSEVMGTGSGEDCLSTSDDGYSLGIQSHSKNRLKSDEQLKDEAYWERRRKNNEAAKRSRDARRAKEDEIAIRAAFLEQENLKLRFEVCALKNERAKLQCMQFNYKGQ